MTVSYEHKVCDRSKPSYNLFKTIFQAHISTFLDGWLWSFIGKNRDSTMVKAQSQYWLYSLSIPLHMYCTEHARDTLTQWRFTIYSISPSLLLLFCFFFSAKQLNLKISRSLLQCEHNCTSSQTVISWVSESIRWDNNFYSPLQFTPSTL